MNELHPGSARWQEREWLRSQPEEWWSDVFDRIACGESAAKVVKGGYCVRVAMFLRVLNEDIGRREEYEAALRIAADSDAHEVVEIADGSTAEDAAVSKVRIDARKWRASKWNRERYGERLQVEKSVKVEVDAGLVGYAGDLLSRLVGGRVVEAGVVSPVEVQALEDAEPATAAGMLPPKSAPGLALERVEI